MKREYMNPEAEIEMFSKKYLLSCSEPDPEGGGIGEGGNEYNF